MKQCYNRCESCLLLCILATLSYSIIGIYVFIFIFQSGMTKRSSFLLMRLKVHMEKRPVNSGHVEMRSSYSSRISTFSLWFCVMLTVLHIHLV